MASPRFRRGIIIFVLTLFVYSLRAGDLLRHPSVAPYFLDLADAFGRGSLDIDHPPAWGYDLIRYHNRWYVAQQPLPALLLLPFVTLVGIDHISDVVVGVVAGAISIALADAVIGMTVPDLSPARCNGLILFLAFGTVHFSLSVMGTVWFLGQIVTVLFVWILIGAVWWDRPVWAGAALGLILLGRPSVVPAALLFATGRWYLCGQFASRRQAVRLLVQLFIPLILAASFLAWYNAARFGDPLEMGYSYIMEAPDIKERFLRYGNFSLAFLPENLFIADLKPPFLHLHCLRESCPLVEPNPVGMGFVWTSPMLLYALLAFCQADIDRNQNLLLAVCVGVALLPSLLYHNPGSAQFGYRFLLDSLPFWLILVARGIKRQPLPKLAALITYCVIVNWWGITWLIEFIT